MAQWDCAACAKKKSSGYGRLTTDEMGYPNDMINRIRALGDPAL